MTLDPWTGFYRLQIWEHGLANVWANPWAGIGLDDWERPWWMISDTVDAFWLVTAMRQGIPSFLLLAIAIILLGHHVIKRRMRHTDGQAQRIAMGWMMSLIALSLIGATVHYWNVLHAYFFFFIGLGAWIADPTRAAWQASPPATGGHRPAPATTKNQGQSRCPGPNPSMDALTVTRGFWRRRRCAAAPTGWRTDAQAGADNKSFNVHRQQSPPEITDCRSTEKAATDATPDPATSAHTQYGQAGT